jgi:hypothetical protein
MAWYRRTGRVEGQGLEGGWRDRGCREVEGTGVEGMVEGLELEGGKGIEEEIEWRDRGWRKEEVSTGESERYD